MRSLSSIPKSDSKLRKKPLAASVKLRRGKKPRSLKPAPTRHGNDLDPVPSLLLAWKYGQG
jgi:hypothetical protein